VSVGSLGHTDPANDGGTRECDTGNKNEKKIV